MILELALVLALGDGAPNFEVRTSRFGPQGREERKLEDYKALLENNIFSPPKARPTSKPPEKAPEPPKPDPVVVTGFYWVGDHYEALVEDRAKKEYRTCKAGDAIGSWTVVSVDQDRMTVKNEAGERSFAVGESVNGVAPAGEKSSQAEGEIDPKKIEEARARRREELRKKGPVEDEEEDPKVEKRNKPKE